MSPAPTAWFLLTPAEVSAQLETSSTEGLASSSVAALQLRDGMNVLSGGGGVSAWSILLGQICNAMILVLIIAMAVCFGIGSYIEGGVITAVILINIVVGFTQCVPFNSCSSFPD